MKDHVRSYKFYSNLYLAGAYEYGNDGIFKLLRWIQKLQGAGLTQSV
jgi:hypothetical protein